MNTNTTNIKIYITALVPIRCIIVCAFHKNKISIGVIFDTLRAAFVFFFFFTFKTTFK